MSPQKKPPEQRYSDPQNYFEGDVMTSYIHSKSMMHIQEQLALRVLDISEVQPPGLILDLGMGAGFSSVPWFLKSFTVIGIELIWDMLVEYDIPELNPIAGNMLHLFFRKDTFNCVFSVSAFQWALLKNGKLNYIALTSMAQNLHYILKNNGICVFQLYESSQVILDDVFSIFVKCGFIGKYIIDNPQSKKKQKTYLYLKKENILRKEL